MSKYAARWVIVLASAVVGACAPASQSAEVAPDGVTLASADVPVQALHPLERGEASSAASQQAVAGNAAPAAARFAGKAAHSESVTSFFDRPRTWKIKGHVNAYLAAMEDEEATELDGHYVMSNTSLVTPWERCEHPRSAFRDASVEEWFGSFDDSGLSGHDREVLGVASGATVRVHDITCTGGEQIEIVESGPNQIILVRDGVAFAATLVRPAAR